MVDDHSETVLALSTFTILPFSLSVMCLRDEEEVMAQYSPSVVSYALGSSSTQRQGSPGSWCGMKSPSRPPSSLSETRSRLVFQKYVSVSVVLHE